MSASSGAAASSGPSLTPLAPRATLAPLDGPASLTPLSGGGSAAGGGCACSAPVAAAAQAPALSPGQERAGLLRRLSIMAVCLVAWWAVYLNLPAASRSLTYGMLGLTPGSHLGEAVEFFLYDTPKVLMLLSLVVFGIGLVRSFFTPQRTRRLLAGRGEAVGNVLAALLGIVTPFCSCSAVPLFIGFVSAGVPLGVTFSFLVSAPMINEIAVVMLYGLLGWKVAALYAGTGLAIAIVSGWIIGRLGMERHIEGWVLQVRAEAEQMHDAGLSWSGRIDYGVQAMRDIVGKVWPWVVLGIGVGAGIHGYVPEGFMASIMGRGAWWAVPLAVAIGIPMYSNAAGMIPVVQALLGKGAALGTVLAFMMAVIALSLPEAVMLRRVLKPRLVAVFFGVVGLGIMLVGYLFNALV
nr:permease [Nitratidesulfovibrio sp. SRB-5]